MSSANPDYFVAFPRTKHFLVVHFCLSTDHFFMTGGHQAGGEFVFCFSESLHPHCKKNLDQGSSVFTPVRARTPKESPQSTLVVVTAANGYSSNYLESS